DLQLGDALAELALDLGLLVGAGAVAEGEGGQVAREADAAGDDDVGLRTGAAQPLAARVGQAIQVHPWPPYDGGGLVNGRLLRSSRPPPRPGDGASTLPHSGRRRRAAGAGAPCPCAAPPGGSAATTAPARRGRLRSRGGSRGGPRRGIPCT